MESLIPTPDAFASRSAECNSDGILAYVSRRNVVLVNIAVFPPVFLDFLEHRNKVSAMCFSKGRNTNLLASGSDDGSVLIWDIGHSSRRQTASFDNPSKILVVEWQHNSDNIVFSADERSYVLEWNIASQTSRALKIKSRNSVYALVSCPHEPNLLAAGLKCGDINILDVSTANVKYQLRGHSDDIIHIAWSPHSVGQLLSASKDNSIRVWSVEKSNTLKIFSSVSPARSGLNIIFSAMWHPRDPNLIICSSQNLVGTWNLITGKPKVQPFDLKNGMRHYKPVSHIDLHGIYRNIIFSVSIDRLIIFWDIEQKKSMHQISTLGGSVYDLAFSQVAVGRLCVAAGDSNVRIWNVASSTKCPTQNYFVGTRSRVTTIAWHPQKENVVAFGTDDGRVGVIDTNSRRPNNLSGNLHKTKVYKLSWGPCHPKNTDENSRGALYLYSCGDGPIFIRSFGRSDADNEESIDFDELRATLGVKDEDSESSHHTEISWKPDFSCLAVGNNNGCIEIYNGFTFALMARLQSQKKLVQNLQWHPTFTSLSSSPSSMHTWLACASYETNIHVYDLTKILSKSDSDGVIDVLDSTRELVGHINKVSALVWSPHLEGRLASASYDGTAQVWDVISGEALANFRGHKTKLFAIAWNVFDPDIIFTGGDDYVVLQWRISEQTETQPPSKGKNRALKKKKPEYGESLKALTEAEENGHQSDATGLQENEEHVTEMNDGSNATELAVSEPVQNEEDDKELQETSEPNATEKSINSEENEVSKPQTGGHGTKRRRRPKNMMPLYATLSRKSKYKELTDCMKVAERYFAMDSKSESFPDSLFEEGDSAHLAFFGDQEAALQWLNVEGAHHRDIGNYYIAYELEVWKGNTGAALREAAERGDLNELLVSFAPSVSHSLWLEMCESYAKQLVQEKFFQRAALYFLACGKVYEAIDLLKSKLCFRDALGIAKARLPSTDPVIKDIISAMCSKLQSDGLNAIAAQWYIVLNQPLKAASLFSDLDCRHLRVSAYICLKAGHVNEAKNYALLCLKRSMLNKQWDIAREMIEEQQPTMNVYRALVNVHESLMNHIDTLQDETDQYGITDKVFDNYYEGSSTVVWRTYLVREQNFLVHVFHSLMSQGLIPLKPEKLSEEIEAVTLLKEKLGEYLPTPNQAMMYASVDLVLFYLTLLSENEEKFMVAAGYLNLLFRNCVPNNYCGVLNNICLFSLPFDVIFDSDAQLVYLQAVGMGNDLLEQFFLWLQSAVEDLRLLDMVMFSGENELKSPETLLSADFLSETTKKLNSLTPVESILAYFLVNFLIQLEALICEKNFHAKCYYKIQMESCFVPDTIDIPHKSHCRDEVQGLLSGSTHDAKEGECSSNIAAVLEDLLLETEKKIESLKRESSLSNRTENKHMEGNVDSEWGLSADKNTGSANELSVNSSSVDLLSDTYSEEQSAESIAGDHNSKDHVEYNNEVLTQSGCTQNEEPNDVAFVERNMRGVPSSHSRCLQSLKFFFYFINRVSSCFCNDNYALLFYLRKKLKMLHNALASRAAGHNLESASNSKGPKHAYVSEGSQNSSQNQVQNPVETSHSSSSVLLDSHSSQQADCDVVPNSEINSTGCDGKPKECVTEGETQDLIFMQQSCKEITEFLDAFPEKGLLFPDVVHASSEIISLCCLVKERCSCQCIEEKVSEFISHVTHWAAKFDTHNVLAHGSRGQSSHVDATGDH